jgi:MFS family permease
VRAWPTGGLWRQADFLKLWSAETISQLGTQVSQLALPLAAILVLDASAFEVALLGALQFLPFLLFTLPAGVWVDRLRRKPILVAADLARAALLATVPIAYALDALTIWQLYAVAFGAGVGTVFFDVAYQSYLPALVRKDQLVEGNSKLEISRSAAFVAGPGMAGTLVAALTAPYAILLDALSFLGSAGFLARIRTEEERPARAVDAHLGRELIEGLRYLLGHRYWRPFAACTATSNFFSQVVGSIFLVYAVRDLDLSPQLIGLSLVPVGIGGLAGAVLAGRIATRFGVGPTIVGAAVVFGPAALLIPLAPGSAPLPFLALSFGLLGVAGIVYNITGISLVQTLTPERLLGRLNASRRFIVWGTIPLGALVGGVLATAFGLRAALFVGAIGSCTCFLPILLSPLRTLREMPTEQEPDPFVPLAPHPPSPVALDA